MKRTLNNLMLIFVCLFAFQSCKKENEVVNLTYEVTLLKNTAYNTSLPENKSNAAYTITAQSNHFKISQLGSEASGITNYSYTPAQDFLGSDRVVISNEEDRKNNGKGSHCGKDKENSKTITINFTVYENNSK